jgi:hypothetical protein
MTKFDLAQHYRHVSQLLQSEYRLSSAYGHHGTKGHMREDLLADALRAIVPDNVKICKGEICDSDGNRTPEFDIVVSQHSDTIKLFGTPRNQVIPVEDVFAVLEVKSVLAQDGILKFNSNISTLNNLNRHYVTTPIYQHMGDVTGQHEYADFCGRPISPVQHVRGVGRIVGGLFAFEAPESKTVQRWLGDLVTEVNFAFIWVLGRMVAARDPETGRWELREAGEDTFATLAFFVLNIIGENDRNKYVKCDTARYFGLLTGEGDS